MPEGRIKKVIADKGFGFIESEDGDLFFHHSALIGVSIEALAEGESVEFTVGRSPKGPCAENIQRN